MSEVSGMFNSLDSDRLYNAAWFAEYFSNFLTNGVYNGGTELSVHVHGGDYILRVSPGRAWIQGYYYANKDTDVQLVPAAADATQDRIDRVILRCDLNTAYRSIRALVLPGTLGSGVPPVLTQDLTGAGIYEISLAQVLITHGTTVLTGAMITDERLDNDVCGLVESLIQADTTTIFNQFDAYYDATTADFNADIVAYQAAIDAQIADWDAWYTANKVAIFDTLYFQFDNWRYRAGCTYTTQNNYPTAGDITETVKLTADNTVIATRVTEFDTPAAGQIRETLHLVDGDVTVTKVTTFATDLVTEVVT